MRSMSIVLTRYIKVHTATETGATGKPGYLGSEMPLKLSP
jgi:hypothetical protein